MTSEIKPTVAERLSDLLASGKYSDIEFLLQNGDKLKGHKLIFAIASPVFEAMMYGDLAENENEIKIDDIDPKGFKTMTEFLYSDNLQLDSVGHAMSVCKAAAKYDLPNLENKTMEFITSNIETEHVLEILEFSKLNSKPYTEEKCIELLQEMPNDVITSDYALKCSIDTLQTIVDEEKLKICEVELFRLVEKWAECYAESNDMLLDDVKPLLKNILMKIRFLCMTVTDYHSLLCKSRLLSVEEKFSLLSNLSKPNSMPLPENFCKSTSFRGPGNEVSFDCKYFPQKCERYLIQWRLKEILNINAEVIYSPTFYVEDNPFKVSFQVLILGGEKYVGIHLRYDSRVKPYNSEWSYIVESTFNITIKELKVSGESVPTTLSPEKYSLGCDKFIKWIDILNEIKNNDECILIEVDLRKKN